MVEVLIVIILAGILTGMAVPGVSRYVAQQDATNARNAFVHMSARARSAAIERGTVMRLRFDVAGDSAWILTGATGIGNVIERLDYATEYQVDMASAGPTPAQVCYTPRGFAQASCTNITSQVNVVFSRNGRSATATVRPLGQVVGR